MSNIIQSGRLWPYFVGGAITMVFGFAVATVIVTGNANIQKSDQYMTNYQDADAKMNDFIKARIIFDKKYKIEYIAKALSPKDSSVSYKLTDKDGKLVNNATLILSTSRPETAEFNQNLKDPKVTNGIYTFSGLSFPKAGIWNLMTKVTIGDDYRFYNIKADTRNSNAYEF